MQVTDALWTIRSRSARWSWDSPVCLADKSGTSLSGITAGSRQAPIDLAAVYLNLEM
jgi:hypothetical protein